MQENDLEPRSADVSRETKETSVRIVLRLDEDPSYQNETGVGFLDHMLDLFAKHGGFGLETTCRGDLHVDEHHTVEDVGITLGQAFARAIGDKAYIGRYGHAYVPMDESLARVVVDLSGRFYLHFDAVFARDLVGDLPAELVHHFWYSFAEHLRCNLHVSVLYGDNAHHQIEAIFKAAARALRAAVHRDTTFSRVASTKGTL
jgi:imidazoleglycerol-phosphate dehydratase